MRPLFRETKGPIENQIRPFARAAQKPLRHINQASQPLATTTTSLTKGFNDLNLLFNALAYNPPGASDEGNLFWLSWLNHNTNAVFFTQDAGGPLRHGLVLLSCSTAGSPSRRESERSSCRPSRTFGVPTRRRSGLPGGCSMETRPPTVTRILIAVGFALSCFGLALFLWIAFGGPLPLKPEGYRFTVPFTEAAQLAAESDVRISGVSVGKVSRSSSPTRATTRMP